ncbi:MAG: hypothetical protein ACYDEC_05075 [Bacteroidia bacterium]
MKTKLYILLFLLSPLLWRGAGGEVLAQTNAVSFSQADRDLLYAIDKRLVRMEATQEQHEKRFESVENRMNNMMLLFGGLVAAIIGFAIWDRRTMIHPFETKVKEIENSLELKSTRVESILSSLRELAKTDNKVAEVLKTHNLL